MSTTNTTPVFNGHSCCIAAAVCDFEAAAYVFLEAFNRASQHTQRVILNTFVSPTDLHGMSLTVGAATLVEALGAMYATTTTANGHALDGCLSAAADHFDTAAHAVLQAVTDTDKDTQHQIYLSYKSCDLPDLDHLDTMSIAAGLAQAAKNLTQTDALSLTIDLWGGHTVAQQNTSDTTWPQAETSAE